MLDFGLAKAFAGDGADANLSQSPTLSMAATQQGVILGTAAYMSPEQARGVTVDKRADIWAFGCVLYEMLTGRQVFKGELMSDVMASALKSDPDYKGPPPTIHPNLGAVLRRCLEKEPKQRWHDVGDVRVELEQVLADTSGTDFQPVVPTTSQPLSQRLTPLVITFVVTGIVAVVGTWLLKPTEPGPVSRFSNVLPADQSFSRTGRHTLDISPDGTRIVYVANSQLYLRDLDELEARPLAGTQENPNSPTFSPDGQSIAYEAFGGELKKIAITGGTSVPVSTIANPFGMTWEENGTIIFGQPNGIMKVPATGGTPELLIETEVGMQVHGPTLLPGGEWVLFTLAATSGADRWDEAEIVLQSLETEERRPLIHGGTDARYVSTGHLVYAVEDVLHAVPFDLTSLSVTGGTVPILDGVSRARGNITGAANFSFSDQGLLVYAVDTFGTGLVPKIVDLDGREETLEIPAGNYTSPHVSPEGQRLALQVDVDGRVDIWLYDLSGVAAPQPLTFGGNDTAAKWSPDGEWVAYGSAIGGTRSIYRKRADLSGLPEQLTTPEEGSQHWPMSWSSDARTLLYIDTPSTDRTEMLIRALSLDSLTSEVLIYNAGSIQTSPRFSSDGDWIAYSSNESNVGGGSGDGSGYEIYLQPFPLTGRMNRVVDGQHPVWSRDGKQLFFKTNLTQLKFVEIATDPNPRWGAPRTFPAATRANSATTPTDSYDVMPDGRVLVIARAADSEASRRPQINVVLNWFEELKELVPVP